MNINQVKWAQTHNWFVSCFKDENGLNVVVADDVVFNGLIETTYLTFHSFTDLKNWAGY